jgi:DnaJ-class molecular chaperone
MPHPSMLQQLVDCPCCHGQGRLVVHDEVRAVAQLLACKVCAGLGGLVAEQCTHCMGAGKVMAQG